nr:molecular chaperone HtpG [Eubacterium sp.]
MKTQHGNLSINSENIFPIIKKWMYSDQDIFVREMISNGADAITKRKKLDAVGEAHLPEGYKAKIDVIVDDKGKTLQFVDNGIGMTAEEVVKDITEIAFSGATEFLEKYKDKADEDQIIGHFGLGFYSAFMVAEQVDIDTLSIAEGAEPVHWECDGSTEYVMGAGDRKEPGTTITLHLNEDSLEYANEYRIREILEKYCSFMPVEIFLSKKDAEPGEETIDEEDLREDDVILERIEKDNKKQVRIRKRPVSISDIHPLWSKQPGDCTEEEYKEFYRHVFLDYKEPLFWIHLNMDYPFNLKGILYFPRINTEYDSIEGKIKLYNNQVFIADNIKEVIPEYLMLLKGVIDCPDLPLNVSRSALQNDGFVEKISNYISKKVADKLSGMYRTDRENYEKYWNDISPFIKYGCLKDEKFSDRMMDFILYEDLDGKFLTMEEYLKAQAGEEPAAAEAGTEETETGEQTAAESAETAETEEQEAHADEPEHVDAEIVGEEEAEPEEDEEKDARTVIYYVTDKAQQSQYINLFRAEDMNAVLLQHTIDQPFIQHVEMKKEDIRFQRIDADLTDDMKEESQEGLKKMAESLEKLFRKVLNQEKLTVKVENLKDEAVSSLITLSEESRRMSDMMKMYSMSGMDMGGDLFAAQATLTLNARNELVKYVYEHS